MTWMELKLSHVHALKLVDLHGPARTRSPAAACGRLPWQSDSTSDNTARVGNILPECRSEHPLMPWNSQLDGWMQGLARHRMQDICSSAGICPQRGVVVSGVRRMNEVNARPARLVLGRVTVFGRVYHFGM